MPVALRPGQEKVVTYISLTKRERRALEMLCDLDETTMSETLRMLVRQEAKRRNVWGASESIEAEG